MFSINNVFFQAADYKTKFQGKEMLCSQIKYLSMSKLSRVGKGFFLFSHCFLTAMQICFHNNWQGERRLAWIPNFCFHNCRVLPCSYQDWESVCLCIIPRIGTVNTWSSRAWASAITSLRKEENQLIAVMHQFQQKKWSMSKRNLASSKWAKGGTPH